MKLGLYSITYHGLWYRGDALTLPQMISRAKKYGYDGIEIPLRAKGQVEPERAPDELPKYAEALGKRDRAILLAATDITRIDEPHAETVLRTLASLGIKRLRLGPRTYDRGRPIAVQDSSAVRISFHGVRTPRIMTTPSTSGRTVLGLLVNR